jgi:hypothetical protein
VTSLETPPHPSALTALPTKWKRTLEQRRYLKETSPNQIKETVYQRVIQYGIAVMLPYLEGWLAETIQPGVRLP